MKTTSKEALKIFYSYSHKDQEYRDQLEHHLNNLKRRYNLQTWFDRQIQAGDNWEEVIEEKLNTSDLIFLLISPDFMHSDYCYNKEMTRALERHAKGEAKVIPILVRYVHWTDAPFSHLQLLPIGARPIKNWTDPDEAFYTIVVEIEKVIQDLLILPKTKEEWLTKGNNLHEIGQYEKAFHAYQQAIRLDPNDAITYFNMGNTLSRLKKYDEALSAYQQAIRLDPNDAITYFNMGNTLYGLKRFDEALLAYQQAVHFDPKDAGLYGNLGNTLHTLKRHDEALLIYNQAIALDPTDAQNYYNKGNALFDLERFDEALRAYDQAILLNPTDADSYHNKGNTLHKLKFYSEANNAYQKARELEGNETWK